MGAMPGRKDTLREALDLIMSLAATRYGRTVGEMMQDLDCSRRTVERILAAIREASVDLEEVRTDEREKRWRMRPNRLVGAVRMTAEEVAEIEAAAARLQQEGLPARAATLRGAANKLRAMMDEAARRRAESDVEALLSSEGLASRPGPRVEVADGVIATLRHALLASHRIRLRYRGAKGEAREHLLEPCGLVYGTRPYLLAVKPGKPEAAMWRLDRVLEVEATEEGFVPREGFDVATLMRDCFGVWREAPMEVVLRFDARAAGDAAGWRFHASQVLEPQPDGTLVVRFRAGGIEEMANHLATWGDTVEVMAPEALRERLAAMGEALVKAHGAGSTGRDERTHASAA
jgi:predicted DNA-binding transcriptional regulator YafY